MEHFICKFSVFSYRAKGIVDDVVTTTINYLATLSGISRRPALGSIFLLKNVCYLRLHYSAKDITGVFF